MGTEAFTRHDLKVHVAKQYYFDGLSQEEIARRVNLSRPSVSRLLNACVKEGIVQIYIDEVSSFGAELALQIKERFDLCHAIVVPSGYNIESTKEKIGQAAARYIQSLLMPDMLIGISWGTTVYHVISHIRSATGVRCSVIELVGDRENQYQDTDANQMALKLANTLGGSCYLLQAPFMVQSRVLHDLLLQEPPIKSHFEMIQNAGVALIGLGAARPEHSAQFRSGYISIEETEKLAQAGAVGEICGTYIDINGDICDDALSERMISVSLESLRRIPEVIGVAAGEMKAEVITGALRGRYINTLIVDENAALRILQL